MASFALRRVLSSTTTLAHLRNSSRQLTYLSSSTLFDLSTQTPPVFGTNGAYSNHLSVGGFLSQSRRGFAKGKKSKDDGESTVQTVPDIGPIVKESTVPLMEAAIVALSRELSKLRTGTEMAQTLREARRIALDVAETWNTSTRGEILFEEAVYLACCLQNDLEVLYLVDQCPGRCPTCARRQLTAPGLQTRGPLAGSLELSAEDATREPDVIRGVGKTYREVFDLEGLGWNDCHPTYLFAQVVSEAIQSQQEGNGGSVFKGVRVLVTEDCPVPGLDSKLLMDCRSETIPSFPEPTPPREISDGIVDLSSVV